MYKKYYPDRTLEHSAKGSQKKNHKYLSRIWKNGKWLYQYAKKQAGYAYGSEYRKDMDKYDDVEDRKLSNMRDVAVKSHSLNKAYIDAEKAGDKEGMKKALETIKRSNDYFDREDAEFRRANHRSSYSAEKYFKSPAYKVDKLTGDFDKSRAERARKKGYEGMAEKYEESYKKSAGAKAKTKVSQLSKSAKSTVDKGKAAIKNLFSKSKPKVTVTDTFTGKKRTPKKPKSSSDTVNIKELSKKNKKK